MKKRILLSLCCLSLMSVNLNAEEVVGLENNINTLQVPSKVIDSRENDDVKFALELGAKTDFWDPGLSSNDGQDILEYDTEGLYLGYAILKTKIHNTDVFTLEKFSTLTSSDDQKELLLEYKNDKKKESSVDGYKMSIQLMKILNYWFDTDFLNGLEYKYQTRNFIGNAELKEDAFYWFGNNPGDLDIDYFRFQKGSNISFKTKFTDNRLLYKFTAEDGMNPFIGVFKSEWSKPTYIDKSTANNNPVFFPATYEIKGLTLGFDMGGNNGFAMNCFLDYGIDNNIYLDNGRNLENTLSEDNIDLTMISYGLDIDYIIPIYSNSYLNLNLLIGGKGYWSRMIASSKGKQGEAIDKETLYSVKTALEATF